MCKTTMSDEFKQQMIKKHFNTVYRLALLKTKNSHTADDVLQEVFLRFLKTDKPFESDEHVKFWLIRVTVNCSNSMLSSSWFKKTVSLPETLAFFNPEESDLYLTVAKLPQKYRTVIHLYYYEDYSVKEIANALKIKESTVKSQLKRGREKLKTMLEKEVDYEF